MSGPDTLLRRAERRLTAAGVPGPRRDARRLWDHAARSAAGDTASAFDAAIARRCAREPVSHITGRRAFWRHAFEVTPDVLDPRPETETLVELALAQPFERVLDLGTGSGCILISLLAERPDATGVGTDVSPGALAVAGRNASRLGVADRLILPLSDWFADVGGRYDLIVSNPPYIAEDEMPGLAPELRHEPRIALTPGGDGLGAYRAIAAGAPACLGPGGRLLVEIGPAQAEAVAALFRASGLDVTGIHPDLDGRMRVVAARRP